MLALAAFLALGAWIGDGLERRVALLVVAVSLAAVGLALRASPGMALAAAAAAALGLGAAAAGIERLAYERTPLRAFVARAEAPRLVHLRGTAVDDAWPRDRLQSVDVDATTATAEGRPLELSGRVRLHVVTDSVEPLVRGGDQVDVWAELRAPRGYANPGSVDAEALARIDGLHAVGFCKSARLLERRRGPPGHVWLEAARGARRWARGVLRAALPEGRERAVVLAMTLGDQRAIDEETAESFRVAGTYHVVALSGAQVALLAGGLAFLLRSAGAGPLLQAALLTPALAFYATLVGGEVPIVRATVMALVALWGRAVDLDVDVANLLGVAAAGLLLAQPSAIGDVGFQLSFAATLGILVLTPVVQRGLPRLPLGLTLAVAASVASQLALWPLLAARFHRVAPAALALNLVAVPLSGLVLLTGLALLAASVVPGLAAVLAPLAWLSANLLLRTGDLVRAWPSLDVRSPDPGTAAVCVYLAGLVAIAQRKRPVAALLLLAGGMVGMQWPAPPADGRLHVDILDVGQGDAIVVRTPAGRVWQVDAGGTATGFDVGEWVVAPYLWSLPVRRLEGIAVSHAHVDHVGGVPFLLRHFAPKAVWEGPAPRTDVAYRTFDKAARVVARQSVWAGTVTTVDGIRLEVLAPRPAGAPPPRTRNDDSLVLRVSFGAVSFLLTGDAETAGEEALPSRRATVLKLSLIHI